MISIHLAMRRRQFLVSSAVGSMAMSGCLRLETRDRRQTENEREPTTSEQDPENETERTTDEDENRTSTPEVSTIPDDFERESLQFYTGDTAEFSITESWAAQGSRSLYQFDGDSTDSKIFAPAVDISRGDTLRFVGRVNVVSPYSWMGPRISLGVGSNENMYGFGFRTLRRENTSGTPGAWINTRFDESTNRSAIVAENGRLSHDVSPSLSDDVIVYCEVTLGEPTLSITAWTGGWNESLWSSASLDDGEYSIEQIGWWCRSGSKTADVEFYIDHLHRV